jgi:predicted ATPase
VQVLLDEGALVRDDGKVRLTKPIAELRIPPTVQGILAARIDRLPANTKDLLQTLSVVGRQFPMSLIRAVVLKSQDDLDRMLNDLQLGEFIYEQPAVGDTEYVFKHALTQEVSHDSVLLERRRQMHQSIGAAIESLYADSIDDHLSELAHHFSRGAETDRAVTYLTLAGRQSLARYAYAEAQAQLREGLRLIEKLPESRQRDVRELELASPLVDAVRTAISFDSGETRQAVLRAARLAEKTGNLVERIKQLNLLRVMMLFSGDFTGAAAMADQLLELAEREGTASSFSNAYNATMQARFYEGDLAGAETQFALWRKYQDAVGSGVFSETNVIMLANGAICAWMMGRADLARNRMAEATAFADALKEPLVLMLAKWLEGQMYRHIRDPERVLRLPRNLSRSARTMAFDLPRASLLSRRGRSLDSATRQKAWFSFAMM